MQPDNGNDDGEDQAVAAAVYAAHEPDDSGLCPTCRQARCLPRQEAARALGHGVSGLNVAVFEPGAVELPGPDRRRR